MTGKNAFTMLDLQYPVFQAPIGAIATPALAAAVSNAGGLGHLAWTWATPDEIRTQHELMRSRTTRPWGANFVLSFPIESKLSLALDLNVKVISFFWGDGSAHLSKIHDAGAIAIQIVGSLADARRAVDAGFDIIVAQGRDAGGHVRGEIGTMSLVPQVVDVAGDTPVLAAGGIADRRGVRAALALGASGVWVGSRFIVAAESNAHPQYRDAVLAADADDTFYSDVFNVGWPDAPLRTICNSTVKAWIAAGRPNAPGRPGEGEVVARHKEGRQILRYSFSSPTREVTGTVEAMAMYAGQGVGSIRESEPAADIVADLSAGLRRA